MAKAIGTMVQVFDEIKFMNLYYSLLKLRSRLLTGKIISAEEIRLELAFRRRKKLDNTTFVAITGSSGKTTTTLLVHHLLRHRFRTALSSGGNTITTFSKNVLEMRRDHQFAIVEVSGHEPGAIDIGCQLLRPQVGIITTVLGEHVTTFRSLENISKEKGRLAENIPATGLLFLNADDPLVLSMRERTKARVVTFGALAGSDYRATDIELSPAGRLRFQCHHRTEQYPLEFGLLGRHFVTSALAAIAVAHQHGMSFPDIAACGRTFRGAEGRCSLHVGSNGSVYVCDTVKAPFATVGLALDAASIFTQVLRKTIVLGTISDTRSSQSERYRLPCKKALSLADRVVIFGQAANRARVDECDWASGRVVRIEEIGGLRDYLGDGVIPGELVLLKGSFKVDHLERIALHSQVPVDCWLQRCGKVTTCFDCSDLRRRG